MTTYYLVASGNINAVSTAFSLSSGGAVTAGPPTTGDTILCDSNSGAANLTINAAISLACFDCNYSGSPGAFTGTVTHNAFTMTITGSGATNVFRLSPGMTYTPVFNATVTFTTTSGTAQLTSAGKMMGSITQNGAGGTVQMQDNLTLFSAFGSLTISAGTWDCNNSGGYTLTAPAIAVGTGTTFIAAGTISVGGGINTNGTAWSMNAGATFTKNSANLVFLGNANANTYGIVAIFGAKIYNNLTLNNNGNPGWLGWNTNSGTFNTITIGSGWGLQSLAGSQTIVCVNLVVNGTFAAPCAIGQSGSSFLTITASGSVTANYCVFTNFTAAGTAVWTTGITNCLGVGVIAGPITFPPWTTSAQIATALWQDLLSSSDFSTAGSVGALIKAVTNLQYTVPAIGRGTVTTGASTTSIPTSAYSPATSASVANQLVGRIVLFDAATTTVALRGQAATISASSASATPTLTVSTLTATPASGDSFSVI